MTVHPAALTLIKEHEGYRSRPYRCPSGELTVGFGHVLRADEDPRCEVSREEAEAVLLADLALRFLPALGRLVRMQLTSAQHSALASFIFNVGVRALETSTLLRKLNAGDYRGAADEFPRWIYGGGKKLPGLVRRREDERAMFMAGSLDE